MSEVAEATFNRVYEDQLDAGMREPSGVREQMLAEGVRFIDEAADVVILTDGNYSFEDHSITLAKFPADKNGFVEGAFTRAIICRNEMNHKGHSNSTPNAKSISLPRDHTLEVKPFECRGGTNFGYKLVAVPNF